MIDSSKAVRTEFSTYFIKYVRINISLDNKLTIINLPQIFSEKHQELLNSKISKIISIENFSIYEKYLSNINKNIQIITLPTNNNDLSMRIQIAKSISNGYRSLQ